MRYGYARVSGASQDLTDQMVRLKAEGCELVYSEQVTGTRVDGTEFMALLDVLTEGDTLVVTKLDRFARSAEDGIRVIKALMRRGARVHILNMGVVEDSPNGRLILTILSGFAEFERDMIVERLAEGKAQARQRIDYRGQPLKYTPQQLTHAMTLLEIYSYTEVERMTGISKATLTRYNSTLKTQG